MIRVLLRGCMGKMGQCITRLCSLRDDMEIVAESISSCRKNLPTGIQHSRRGHGKLMLPWILLGLRPTHCFLLFGKTAPLLLATPPLPEKGWSVYKRIEDPCFHGQQSFMGITLLRRLVCRKPPALWRGMTWRSSSATTTKVGCSQRYRTYLARC